VTRGDSYCQLDFCRTCPLAYTCDGSCGFCLLPTPTPTPAPSAHPSLPPTPEPTEPPSASPSPLPTPEPTPLPTLAPSHLPSAAPTAYPRPFCNSTNASTPVLLFRMGLSSTAAAPSSGWANGAMFTVDKVVSGGSSSQQQQANGTLRQGQTTHTEWLCLPEGCFVVTVSPADSNARWAIYESEEVSSGSSNEAYVTGSGQDGSSSVQFCTKGGAFLREPTFNPTVSSAPSLVPLSAPSPRPSPDPTQRPSLPPSPQPTFFPSPAPTAVPTLSPTQQCGAGQYLDFTTGTTCESCPAGRFLAFNSSSSLALQRPWPTNCNKCPAGRVAKAVGQSSCEACSQRGSSGVRAVLSGYMCRQKHMFIQKLICSPYFCLSSPPSPSPPQSYRHNFFCAICLCNSVDNSPSPPHTIV
jgi:hypothetical protein